MYIKTKVFFFVLIINVLSLFAVDKIYLNDNWQFKMVGDSVWYPATVPGTVHTDLYNNGLITDPFYRDNEKDLQWIENEDWEYKCEFDISDSVYNQNNVDLTFEGLDTYAKVYLNDSLIITADNMFRKWEAECKRLILKGKNILYILFESPIKKARELKSGPELPGGDRVYTRKAAYQYGWDFGPRFVTSGIWKQVYIESIKDGKITNIYFKFKELSDTLARIDFSIFAVNMQLGKYDYYIQDIETLEKLSNGQITIHDSNSTGFIAGLNVDILRPHLWWCNGLGDPYLYKFKFVVEKSNKILDEKLLDIALKKVELVNVKDSIGESFYFKLNGIPLFIKGANYVPQDNFLPNLSKDEGMKIVDDAVSSNMNMLRVWGGGTYEDEDFYNFCDEKGILIWQDFMFANGMYPGYDSFLLNVSSEANKMTDELTNHPCVSLLCGNNEIEEGWKNWGWQKELNYGEADSIMIWKNYELIFHSRLPSRIGIRNNPNPNLNFQYSIPYIFTSPKIGWGHPEAMKEGDSHYWGVWWGMEPFEIYEKKIPRFMSEYGFQGFPDMKTIEQFTLPEDRYLYSPVMKAHQKHPTGYETIQTYMEREYKQPKDFKSYVYVSQLLQAYGIKRAIEAHRRAKPYCLGTMYWQLNDCWPGVTWSGIDYYGRWKAMQYFVKEAYKDILVSVHEENDSIKIYIVSDRLKETRGSLEIMLKDFSGNEFLNFGRIGRASILIIDSLKLPPNSSMVEWSDGKENMLLLSDSLKDIVLSLKFTDDEGNEYRNLYYFVPPKDLALENPKISYTLDCNTGEIILTAKKLAKNVHIIIDDPTAPLNLEKNYFDILPGETVKLETGIKNLDTSSIIISSLYNSF